MNCVKELRLLLVFGMFIIFVGKVKVWLVVIFLIWRLLWWNIIIILFFGWLGSMFMVLLMNLCFWFMLYMLWYKRMILNFCFWELGVLYILICEVKVEWLRLVVCFRFGKGLNWSYFFNLEVNSLFGLKVLYFVIFCFWLLGKCLSMFFGLGLIFSIDMWRWDWKSGFKSCDSWGMMKFW